MAVVDAFPPFDQVVQELRSPKQDDDVIVDSVITPVNTIKSTSKVERVCEVCGDRASGCHYKCWTCEGCKGFFRRTVQKNQVYTCEWDNSCIIDKLTRTQCQKCRYDKCIAVGMIAYTPPSSNEKRLTKRFGIDTTIPVIKEDFYAIDSSVNGLLSLVCQAFKECFTRRSHCNLQPISTTNGVVTFHQFTELLSPTLGRIIRFVKSIPQFNVLMPCEQTSLLFTSCLEIMYLRLAIRYDVTRQAFPLNDNKFLTISTVQNMPELNFLLPIFHCAQRIAPYKLDETEAALLSALWLFQPTRPDLNDPARVEAVQDVLLDVLSRYCRMGSGDELRWLNILMARPPVVRGISVGLQNNIPLLYYCVDNMRAVPISLVYLLHENI